MSGKVIEFLGQQKYRFDFGTDGKLYVVIFNAKIPQAELKKLLSSLGNCLYEKMPGAILSYLEQHHFEFSGYNSIEIPQSATPLLPQYSLDASSSLAVKGLARCFLNTHSLTISSPSTFTATKSEQYSPSSSPSSSTWHLNSFTSGFPSSLSAYLDSMPLKVLATPSAHLPMLLFSHLLPL